MLFKDKYWFKYFLYLLFVLLSLLVLYRIKLVLTPFILGIILAYLFNPVIEFLQKKEFTRRGAITILLIAILNIFLITGIIFVPVFITELENLAEVLPEYIQALEKMVEGINREYDRVQLPGVIREGINETLNRIEELISGLIKNIIDLILDSIGFLFSLLLAPVITYYILRDKDILKRTAIKLFPLHHRKFVYKLSSGINHVFVGFLRGQVWISLLVGVLVTAGLYLLQVRFFLLLGILAAITNIIPYIGPILGSIPALLLALMSSYLHALAVALLYIFIQQIESYFIAPKVMSKKVGLHPLLVIFALLVGAELAGVWGLLFAVPLAGCIKIMIRTISRRKIQYN